MLLLKIFKGTDDMISHFNRLIEKKGLILLEPHSLTMNMEIVYQTGNHLNFGRVVAIRDDGCETLIPVNKIYGNYSPMYYLTPIYLKM